MVIPTECHKLVMTLAHRIPLAGKLGKKTTDCILQSYYWPLYIAWLLSFVVRYLLSLSNVISGEHLELCIILLLFERIAMDIMVHFLKVEKI